MEKLLTTKIQLFMRLLLVFLISSLTLGQTSANEAQSPRVSLDLHNATIKSVLEKIEEMSDYSFVYNDNLVDVERKVSISVNNVEISKVLDVIFSDEDVTYSLIGNHIVIAPKNTESSRAATQAQQQKKISGTVVDDQGVPIIGASILENNSTTNGVVSDVDGHFSISINPESSLVVSCIGYVTKTVSVGDDTDLRIVLEVDRKLLDEVVVIGYGTQKRSDVSGSVATVTGEKLNKMPTANAEAALQGMVPGLSVNFASGDAGSSATLQVRGVTTWGTDNSPLVIIDGIPGDMSYLNPEDIKSMSVLKDAATAAIYGARAAAGVILIETNRGSNQKPKVNFSAYMGVDDLPKKLEVCNSEEFIKVREMALTNAGYAENRWPKYISEYHRDPSQFADTDWQDEYYRRGLVQKYTLGFTSGNEYSNLSVSGFYSKTDNIVVGTWDTKYGVRINSDITKGKLKAGESFSYSRWEAEMEASTGYPSIYQVTNMEPLAFVYDEDNDGGYGGAIEGMGMSDAANMVGFNNLIENSASNDYLSGSGYIQYELIKGLVIKFQASRNIYYNSSRYFVPTYKIGAMKENTRASLTETRSRTTNDLLELTANYDKTIGDHEFSALLGLSQEESRYKDISASGVKFENNDMSLLEHAQEDYAVDGGKTRSGLRSAFGRINYNYKMRYLLSASARYDGSSRFASGNKWGFFPSVSLGWNIANEPFWENLKDDVSTFKLRISYGALGNQSIGLYRYIPTLSSNTDALNYPFGGTDVSLGYAITSLPSSDIKWETTIYDNIGIDLGLWQNKLEITAEAYIKNTKDMLSTKNISLSTGFGALTVNDGKLRTKGFEISAIYHGTAGDFKYDLDMNINHYKSVLKAMADPTYLDEYGAIRTYVGGQIGELWAYETAGIFQNEQEVQEWNAEHGYDLNGQWQGMQPLAEPGDIRFVDQNGDGMLDSSDKIKMGCGTPKVSLGFNINLAYKNFDLVANFIGDFGVKRYNYSKYVLEKMDGVFNYGKNCLNAWTPENTDTDIPRAVQGDPNGNSRISDRFIENGDYLRLNNFQIGYNLPSNICKKLKIGFLRVYVGGTRLFTITGYSGYDPSTGATVGRIGYDYAAAPLCRTYMAGIKFGF